MPPPLNFHTALVERGEAIYNAALRDPQMLAEAEPSVFPDEVWTYISNKAYRAKTGEDLPASAYGDHPSGPAGDSWDEEAVGEKYPRLAEKFDYQDGARALLQAMPATMTPRA